jgi:hypothetical protein
MFGRKENVDPDNFWAEYEEKLAEKVLEKSLGRYISGGEYGEPLWGLVIVTSGGFRFHHFPHEGWLMAISRATTGGAAPKEKTIFIPKEGIVSTELRIEKRWWKRLLTPSMPMLFVRYRDGESEAELIVEVDRKAEPLITALENLKAE